MKRLLWLMACAACSSAGAAETYMRDGTEYVDLVAFAAENGIKLENDQGNLTLIRGGTRVYIEANSANMTVNGKPVQMGGRVSSIFDKLVVPSADIFRAFGLKGAAPAEARAGTSAPPRPAPSTGVVAPNGYFKHGSKELPAKRVEGDGFSVTPSTTPVTELGIFDPRFIDMRAKLDGTPLTPSTVLKWCQGYVIDGLKAPSTATLLKASVIVYPNKVWTILGEFDAQNSYGALVRGSYTCFVRTNGTTLEGVHNIITRK